MLKGCLLSLVAMAAGLLLLIPLVGLFDYMGWPGFNSAGMHVGTWIFALPFLFGISYCALLAIDRWWRARSMHI